MNDHLITRQVEDYIAYKKGLGYQIKVESGELRRFAAYTQSIGYEGSLTVDLAFQWAMLKPEYSRWYMARRMETVRTFAKYICVFDPDAQMLPKGMFGKCHGRTTPYIFSNEEICTLMKEATKLYSPDGLRRITIATAIGLLWVTGMRPSVKSIEREGDKAVIATYCGETFVAWDSKNSRSLRWLRNSYYKTPCKRCGIPEWKVEKYAKTGFK